MMQSCFRLKLPYISVPPSWLGLKAVSDRTSSHAMADRALSSSLFIYEQLTVFFSTSQRFSVGPSLYTQHMSVTD